MTSILERTEIRSETHPVLDTPIIHELLHPERNLWDAGQLRDLTRTIAQDFAQPLFSILTFNPQQRWWARLGLTVGVELWLLSWLPGQGTEPHDHGGAAGSFTVLTGELTEDFRYPGGPIRTMLRTSGAGIGFGAGHAHIVRNTADVVAASVHAYSPPLTATREYVSLLDIPDHIPALPAHQHSFAQLKALADADLVVEPSANNIH